MTVMKWGVLGISKHFQLRINTPLLKNINNTFHGIASRDSKKAVKAARELGIPEVYESYQELIDNPEIQAVYIPLPNNLHLEWIEKAAKAGKHILCEKPLTLNAGDTRKAFKTSLDKGVYLMEAFMFQFHPMWKRIREIVRSGEIGKIKGIQTFFTYNNKDENNIRNKPELGGGAIRDIGCYGIASANFISDCLPERVISSIRKDPVFKTDVLSSFILDYPDFQLQCTVSTQSWPCQSVKILGTGGLIEIFIPFNIFPDVGVDARVITGVGERIVKSGPADQYGCQFDAFTSAASKKDDDFFGKLADFSINIQVIMDSVFKSGNDDRWVYPEY